MATGRSGDARAGAEGRAPVLRRARAADIETLVAHRRAMFFAIGGHTTAELDRADPVYRRWIRARLAERRAVAMLATRQGRPVGSAVLWLREEQPRPGRGPPGLPYVMSVFVAPAERGQGIAGRLTDALVRWARSRGYGRITLHATRFGRSVYRRLGFERTWEMRLGGTTHRPRTRRPLDEPRGRAVRARRRSSRPRPR